MTDLTKPVRRRTDSTIRDAGKPRRIVTTLYPGDTLGLRPEKTRREEFISLTTVYEYAIKLRVRKEQAERRARKGKRS